MEATRSYLPSFTKNTQEYFKENGLGLDKFVWIKIFKLLSIADIPNVSRVCKHWFTTTSSQYFWKAKFAIDFPDTLNHISPLETDFKKNYRKSVRVNENIKKFTASFINVATISLHSIFNFQDRLVLCSHNEKGTTLLFINHDVSTLPVENEMFFRNDYFMNYQVCNDKLFIGLESSIKVLTPTNKAFNLETIPVCTLKNDQESKLVIFDIQEEKLIVQYTDHSLFIFNSKDNYKIIKKFNYSTFGKIDKNSFYFVSTDSMSLVSWDIESDLISNEFKSDSSYFSKFHIHQNKLFINLSATKFIEMWDIQKGEKLEQKFQYHIENSLINQMQVYDDKLFTLFNIYRGGEGFSFMYIWNLNNGQLISSISHSALVNSFVYMHNKYCFSSIYSPRVGSICVRNFEEAEEVNPKKRKEEVVEAALTKKKK